MKLREETIEELVHSAIKARTFAHAPYSKFSVGAALLVGSGDEQKIFTGCNVENGVLGLSICAERVAITKAVSCGFSKHFAAIAVAANPAATPCGPCRQFLSEFANDLPVIVVDSEKANDFQEFQLADLLPNAFRFEQNP